MPIILVFGVNVAFSFDDLAVPIALAASFFVTEI
ncbi:hypothetical protein MY11210_006320, partial [Beauveria gryllotalpidicola]